MYASRTLIQDCASRFREERRRGEGMEGAEFRRDRVSPGNWEDRESPKNSAESRGRNRSYPSAAAAATPGIHSAADVGRHLGIDIR